MKELVKKLNIKFNKKVLSYQQRVKYIWKDEVWLYRAKKDASKEVGQFIVYPDEIIDIYKAKINKVGYPISLFDILMSKIDGTSKLYKN